MSTRNLTIAQGLAGVLMFLSWIGEHVYLDTWTSRRSEVEQRAQFVNGEMTKAQVWLLTCPQLPSPWSEEPILGGLTLVLDGGLHLDRPRPHRSRRSPGGLPWLRRARESEAGPEASSLRLTASRANITASIHEPG